MSGMEPESNANLGRNTVDPSGMQAPNEDGGALPPSSGEEPSAKGGWLAFWILLALVLIGGIVWWLVVSGDDAEPEGVPSPSPSASASVTPTPTPSPSPSVSPSASEEPSPEPTAPSGDQLASGDFAPTWPDPVPRFDGPLEPLGTGWENFYQYAAYLVTYQCGEAFNTDAVQYTGYIQLDGAVQSSVSGPDADFAFASRMVNTSDTDLTNTVWQGPEVMFIDSNGTVVAVTRVESQPIDRPEFSDTPPGSFAPGDSIEIYGAHGPIRQCLSSSADLDSGEPNPDWAPIGTQAVLAAGTYDAVIRTSQPYAVDLVVDGEDIGNNPADLVYVQLGQVTITE